MTGVQTCALPICLDQSLGGLRRDRAMEVDGDVDLRADRLAHRREDGDDVVGVLGSFDDAPVAPQANAGLDAVEAVGDRVADALCRRFRGRATGRAIHADPVTRGPAEKLVDGDAEPLAGDVPQGLLDAG